MAQIEADRAVLLRECWEEVDRASARHAWQLLDRDVWARQAVELVIGGSATNPRRAVIYSYSRALHAACSRAEGVQRQNMGYGELFRYLYDVARRRCPDIAEDAAQRALESTFTLFDRCRDPGTFLAFASQQLLAAASTIRRHDRRFGWTQAIGGGEPYADLAALPDQRQDDLATPIIADELRARFEQLSVEFLRKHPRASQQLAALRLKYIDGLDEATISQRLGKPISSVYVLRARAVEKLREEAAWRALAVEFGIFLED